MKKMMQKVSNFWYDEAGATAVEYGMMVALIAAVIVGTVQTIGTELKTAFGTVLTALQAAA